MIHSGTYTIRTTSRDVCVYIEIVRFSGIDVRTNRDRECKPGPWLSMIHGKIKCKNETTNARNPTAGQAQDG